MIHLCYCMNFPSLPIKGNYDVSRFKLYMNDTGLLIASLDEEVQENVRSNKALGGYKGGLYENMVAEAFVKQELPLVYFSKQNSTLEEDFFIRTADCLIPVEVKANNNRSKSLRTLIQGEQYEDIRSFLADRKSVNSADTRDIIYDRLKKGFVMTGNEAAIMTNSEILAVSFSIFLLFSSAEMPPFGMSAYL